MSAPGNVRVANAVPPFEKDSESNLRVLFSFWNPASGFGSRRKRFRSTLWSYSEHYVEAACCFTCLGAGNALEVNGHRFLQLGITKTFEDKVSFVPWVTFDIALGIELFASLGLDGDVEMRSSSGIRHRLDGAEIIFTGGTREEPAIALEILVQLVAISSSRMQIDAVCVHLP